MGDIDLDGYYDLIVNIVTDDKKRLLALRNTNCPENHNNNVEEQLCRFFDLEFM